MFDNHKLGAYILYLRKKRGMTQSQLAELLGISPQAVSNWERGESMPDIALLGSVARTLGTTTDKLLAAAENYEAAEEEPAESPDDELERLKVELEETKRRVREAESRVKNADKEEGRAHIHIPSWQEVSEKLPNLQEVADNARVLGRDVGEKAKEIFDAAQEFTRKRVEQVEREVERYRRERNEQRDRSPGGSEGDDDEEIDLGLLISLAPYASREGVDAMLDQLPGEAVRNLSELGSVSPFAGEEALGRLVRRVLAAHPEKDAVPGLLALAPFLSEADLRDIIMDEGSSIAVSKLSAFAPFLQEKDIDELILRIARKRQKGGTEETPKEEI